MTAGLVDARALWWHVADDCSHNPDEDGCDCWMEPGWDLAPFGIAGELAGHRYVSDRYLLIREDRLSNWPDPDDSARPFLLDFGSPSYSFVRPELVRLLATEADPWAGCGREFNPLLLGPLRDAGYDVEPLASALNPRAVHAVVDPAGLRVGLLVPTATAGVPA